MHGPEVREEILTRLAEGESLRAICRDDGMPQEPSVRQWATDDVDGFASQYAQARERGYERMAESIIEISDETAVTVVYKGDQVSLELDATAVARNRLRVDSRKWLLSKMMPKKYGDKTTIAGDADAPVAVSLQVTFK